MLLLAGLITCFAVNRVKAFIYVCSPTQLTASQLTPSDLPTSIKPISLVASNGIRYWLGITPKPLAKCENVGIGVDAANVAGIHPIAPSLLQKHDNNLYVNGIVQDGEMIVSSIEGTKHIGERRVAERRDPSPIERNLLGQLMVRSFGAEERAEFIINSRGEISLNCRQGKKPAGIILRVPWFMPHADLSLELDSSGHGVFHVSLIDHLMEKREGSYLLGAFDAEVKGTNRFEILHGGLVREQWRALSFSCPNSGGQLDLSTLRLMPNLMHAPKRATWIWKTSDWKNQPATVFAHAQKYGISTLYISIEVRDGAIDDAKALAAFVREATLQGLEVWSVDGDPYMVLPSEHPVTISRAKAYVAFNRSVDRTGQLRGMQFDIEPYVMKDYDVAPIEWDRHYLSLAKELHLAADGLALEMVVPYWWGDKMTLLDSLAPFVTNLNVMDYRTNPQEIYRFAVPFLDWGSKHNKKVRIALEAGPIKAETRWSYVKVRQGETWLLAVKEMAVMLHLRQRQWNLRGPSFSLQSSTTSDTTTVTFYGKQEQMNALLPQLEKYFSAWEAFSGIALHELQ